MSTSLRFLLLQMRNPDDPMRSHEVGCFAHAFRIQNEQIRVVDLLDGCPSRETLDSVDMVLLGGSGDHSVSDGGPWLESALDAMRMLHDLDKPTFASCWGCQAMALAMGGEVVRDMSRAEVGTHTLRLTRNGAADPVFGPLGSSFPAQMGHQDIIDRIPDDAVLLASSDRVENQAFRFVGRPIYCTQFHPELTKTTLLDRLRTYPQYIERIVGEPFDTFVQTCRESHETDQLLARFAAHVFTDRFHIDV